MEFRGPNKWPYKWVTGAITPAHGIMNLIGAHFVITCVTSQKDISISRNGISHSAISDHVAIIRIIKDESLKLFPMKYVSHRPIDSHDGSMWDWYIYLHVYHKKSTIHVAKLYQSHGAYGYIIPQEIHHQLGLLGYSVDFGLTNMSTCWVSCWVEIS